MSRTTHPQSMNHRLVHVSFCLALFAACGGDAPPEKRASPAKTPPLTAFQVAAREKQAMKDAQQQFDSLCLTCHGSVGHGDGPGAAAINPKPRSFADVAWQDSVTDEQIQKAIVFGGAAVGKSPVMPTQPQLKGQTEMLNGLTKIVRAFRGKP